MTAARQISTCGSAGAGEMDARYFCARCGASGECSGPGPHACPCCDELLQRLCLPPAEPVEPHQPIVEVATAYDGLADDLRAELRAAFDGELSMAQIHALARRLVWRVDADKLTCVVARLICLADERPEPALAATPLDIDLSQMGEGPSIEVGDTL